MSTKWKAIVLAALIACTPVAQPRPAGAQVTGAETQAAGADRTKLWDYLTCGASIVFASGTGAWVLAVIACSRAIVEHR